MEIGPRVPGAARLHLADGIPLLRPEEQVFTAMLEGWRNQQLARNLALATITARDRAARAFTDHADTFPWQWTATMLDEWLGDLRAVRRLRRSTLRGYQEAIRMLCLYLTDPAYGWTGECETRFGTHPVQVVHEWNTAVHVQQAEGDPIKRAFTIDELQAFFDHADDEVARIRAAGRKGWLPAFRDATLFKIAHGYWLRRNETRMLDVADFGTNPHAPEFGEHGVCYVRHGKAMKGSAPKRRSVLTVWPWVTEAPTEWTTEIRPLLADKSVPASAALWPSERAPRVGLAQIDARFAAIRTTLGLGTGLDFHSLRRSYVTHLIEAGWDPLFVQHQVGHEHASTTAIHTCVSSDFRTRTLRRALDATLAQATTGTTAAGTTAAATAGGGERNRGGGRAAARREPRVTRRREVSYQWRLRELMAGRGLFTTTHLAPLLAERGITLSASQIHRLVTGTPERLSLPVLAALCDATTRKTAASPASVAGPAELRPTRARFRPEP